LTKAKAQSETQGTVGRKLSDCHCPIPTSNEQATMTTLAEIFATYPLGDDRLAALAAWQAAEDARLAKEPPPVKVQTGKRLVQPPSVSVEPPSHVATTDDARPKWERRRDEAQSAKEAEAAAAIRARLKRVVDLTQARLGRWLIQKQRRRNWFD
jgi:hypothetical protein